MKLENIRLEVMQTIELGMGGILTKYLKPIDKNWQPQDILPDSKDPSFFEEIRELQGQAKEMDHDLLTVLIGDTITEEALPTYESWLMNVEGVDSEGRNGWSQWVRSWTAEENRHGDALNKYLYLCGRVNMQEMETSTQHLISDGFDIQTGRDPYRNFVYTSFQELATNISHRRVASLVKKSGNHQLAKMCGLIASDEARHAKAYIHFVKLIMELDPSEMMLAFKDMMQKKIVMPAHFMRESGQQIGDLYAQFSDAAQRIKVYTTDDYIDILKSLLIEWNIDSVTGLSDAAEKARDFVMRLPQRLERISERIVVPKTQQPFKWVST
ncbi:MAG: acyl-ACP desaturase [Bacteroidia bacterium]|jgi:acyl-[acyl-carrier-protein] desaturase|nr:acyl-ACP desaturase [Bacteroidia bacterium]